VFRTVLARHFPGLDGAMAPFVGISKARKRYGKLIEDLEPERNTALPTVPQLLGGDPEGFTALALALGDQGHRVVNWNIGCPYRTVTSKLRGAGLLPHPQLVDRFLDEVCSSLAGVDGPVVSVKTRLGLEDPDELERLIPILNSHPLAEVIIHPRTGRQYYEGSCNLAAFESAAGRLRVPVVYNGDIRTVADFLRRVGRFAEIRSWMIGRGILANPFLVESLRRGTEVPFDLERFRRFHDDLVAGYVGTKRNGTAVAGRMKEFWGHAARTLAVSEGLLRAVMATRNLEAYRTAADALFAHLARSLAC
jgi:tRNA-dihydrouridine synthase B